MLDKLFYYTLTFAEAGLAIVGMRGVYEQPTYAVLEDLGGSMEIREYGPRVAAEATVRETDPDKSAGIAFGLLFDYITGANDGNRLVAMTAPVQRDVAPERIAMTAPVQTNIQSGPEGAQLTMRFFLPAAVRDHPPRPADPRVTIVTVPTVTVAAIRFSGVLDDTSRTARERELLERLARTAWLPTSKPYVFAYDPPFTIPFLRRNEIAIEVARP
jgi:SOUL heme-binding protein